MCSLSLIKVTTCASASIAFKHVHFLCNLLLGEMILCIVITQPQHGYSKIRHKFWCPAKWRRWARHSVCVTVKMQCVHSGFLHGHIMSLFPCFIPDSGVHFFVLIYGWVVPGNTLKCRKKGSAGLLLGFLCSFPLETRMCYSMWWNWNLYLTFPHLLCAVEDEHQTVFCCQICSAPGI